MVWNLITDVVAQCPLIVVLLLRRVDAILVPRTEIVRHFRDSGLAFTNCGNPFKMVGETAKPEVCLFVCVRVCPHFSDLKNAHLAFRVSR